MKEIPENSLTLLPFEDIQKGLQFATWKKYPHQKQTRLAS
jgi:hypothetical protein